MTLLVKCVKPASVLRCRGVTFLRTNRIASLDHQNLAFLHKLNQQNARLTPTPSYRSRALCQDWRRPELFPTLQIKPYNFPASSIIFARHFRWDSKPDNVFGHSMKKPMYSSNGSWFMLLLCGCLVAVFFDFEEIKEQTGIDFVPSTMFKEWKEYVKKKRGVPREDVVPSSLAGEIYDRFGEEGLDAAVAAWEENKKKDERLDTRAMHSIMMAQAREQYRKDVTEEAEKLGLAEDPEVKKMIEGLAVVEKKDNLEENFVGRVLKKASVNAESQEIEAIEDDDKKSEKIGFRDRKIIEYENRIRQYSTPDKVFRYFSTYKVVDERGNSEVMMTPQDFLRSISPGVKQPEDLGLDQFMLVKVAELEGMVSQRLEIPSESIFYQLGAGGLISFSDYIFLLTVLSTSRRHFQIAFKMFDLNGDGDVDAGEFEKVTNLMRSHSSTGARHRDHGNTGNTFKGINSGLITYFFGEEKKGILTVERFLQFQRALQQEILELEFRRKDVKDNGRISEKDFADLLIAYAGFNRKKKSKMLRRVRKNYDDEATDVSPGVSLVDYLSFYQVLYSINDIDTALTFYHIAGAPIERGTMKHVARTVAHVDLSDHLIDVVFTLFDDNGDGKLSNNEFVSVMKQRAMRGLEKPKDMGISRILSAISKCASDAKPAIMGGLRKTE